MKKVVILVICIIYLASIVIVNFFGLEIAVFEGTTYVNEIVVEKLEIRDFTGSGNNQVAYKGENFQVINKQNYDLYKFNYIPPKEGTEYTIENIGDNPNIIWVDIYVYPYNANSKGVEFLYDEAATEGRVLFLQEERTIVFLQPCTVSLVLKSIDGSNIMTKQFYISMK